MELLSSVCQHALKTDFYTLKSDMLFEQGERSAFLFIQEFVNSYGELPTISTLQTAGFDAVELEEPYLYYYDRCVTRFGVRCLTGEYATFIDCIKQRHVSRAIRIMLSGIARYHDVANVRMDVRSEFSLVSEEAEALGNLNRFLENENQILFGWPTLDECTMGSRGGDFVVVAGRTSIGKSYILLQWCRNAQLQGKRCLFVSMEMQLRPIIQRFMAICTGVNSKYFREGLVSTRTLEHIIEWQEENMERYHPIQFMSSASTRTVDDIRAAVNTYMPDVVYLDSGYLLSPSKGKPRMSSHRERVSELGEEMQGMCNDLNIPLIATFQLNRNAVPTKKEQTAAQTRRGTSLEDPNTNAGVQLHNIYGTDEFGQLATIMIGIGMGRPPYEKMQREIRILKNREGPLQDFTIKYQMSPTCIEEIQGQTSGAVIDTEMYQSMI
jgi:hypothetical protein